MQALDLELAPTPQAVAEARVAVTQRFDDLPRPALDDLRLLITELVGNAVAHGGVGSHEQVCVRVSVEGDCLHAEVIDGGMGADIRARPLDLETPGGFGLNLVERLSDRWGVRHGRRTCVWFELTPRNLSA